MAVIHAGSGDPLDFNYKRLAFLGGMAAHAGKSFWIDWGIDILGENQKHMKFSPPRRLEEAASKHERTIGWRSMGPASFPLPFLLLLCMSMAPAMLSTDTGPMRASAAAAAVTILEPFDGQVLWDSRTVVLLLGTVGGETVGEKLDLVINLHCEALDLAGLESLTLQTEGTGEIFERFFSFNDLPNGEYRISVEKVEGGGMLAESNFSISVFVQMGKVEEGEGVIGGFSEGDLHALSANVCELHGLGRRTRPAKIYDCFPVLNELDLLHVRIHEIAHLVEKFVIIEAPITYSGLPKPMLFRDNAHLFDYAKDKIRLVELTAADFSGKPSSWDKEHVQRNSLLRGLSDAQAEDLVIISDLDEIPRERSLRLLRVCQGYSSLLEMRASYHFYGFYTKFAQSWHLGPKVVTRDSLHGVFDPEMLRHTFPDEKVQGSLLGVLEDSAWHCSYFIDPLDGSADVVVVKLKSFAHTEWSHDNFTAADRIMTFVKNGTDIFGEYENMKGRGGGLLKVPHEGCTRETLPWLVWEHKSWYRHWLPHCFLGMQFPEAEAPESRRRRAGEYTPPTFARMQDSGSGTGFPASEGALPVPNSVPAGAEGSLSAPSSSDFPAAKSSLKGSMLPTEKKFKASDGSPCQSEERVATVTMGTSSVDSDEGSSPASDVHRALSPPYDNHQFSILTFPLLRYSGQEGNSPENIAFLGFAASFEVDLPKGPNVCASAADIVVSGIFAGHGEPNPAHIAIGSACTPGVGSLHVCFVAFRMGHATFEVKRGGSHLVGSPFSVHVLPSSEANHSCVRPGTASITSPCRSDVDENNLPDISSFPPAAGADGVQDSHTGASEMGLSTLSIVENNLYYATNACVHANRLVLFGGKGQVTDKSEHAMMRLDLHLWGQVDEGSFEVGVEIVNESINDFAERVNASLSDGNVGAGAGPLYIYPEGPSTHYGHAMVDSVVPLFSTMLHVIENRSRVNVILWPSKTFSCPTTGPSVHANKFWDLFSGVTQFPHQDVRRLPQILTSGPVCFVEAFIGGITDSRVGSNGFYYPFAEDFQLWSAKLRHSLGLKSPLLARPQHQTPGTVALKALILNRATRKMSNQDEVGEATFAAGFQAHHVAWAGMSLVRQIELSAEADLFIGMHGSEFLNLLFARMGTVAIVFLIYCRACLRNRDMLEVFDSQRLRWYWWQNPDPRRSSCPAGTSPSECTVPDCGYAPARDMLQTCGGGDNICMQDTRVDLLMLRAFLADAQGYLQGTGGGGVGGTSATECRDGGVHVVVCDDVMPPLVCDDLVLQDDTGSRVLQVCRGNIGVSRLRKRQLEL